jgi:hypothetical protein
LIKVIKVQGGAGVDAMLLPDAGCKAMITVRVLAGIRHAGEYHTINRAMCLAVPHSMVSINISSASDDRQNQIILQ